MARKSIIPGLSYSWKRAVGISSVKQRIARTTGIPTTRQGRQRKVGRMVGCMIPMSLITIAFVIVFVWSLM
jgi:hypothetical protein